MGKIYFVYDQYCPNRASCNRALGYMRALSQKGVEATIIYLMPDANYSKIYDVLPGINVEYCWENGYIDVRFIKNVSYIYYLIKLFFRLKSGDIVYTYSDVDILALVERKKGIKLFHEVTEHPFVHPPRGRLLKMGVKTYCKKCSRLEGLFVISTSLKKFFVENSVSERIITIVNMTVDPKRFEGLIKNSNDHYFTYCGNANNKKDKVDDLIRVFSKISVTKSNLYLLVIGPKPNTVSPDNNLGLVEQLGVRDRVVFTGLLSAEEIPQKLINSEALFLTRLDNLQNQAGFPTKLGEYLITGIPVVVAGVGDIPKFLTNEKNAYVYEPGNLEELEQCMRDILLDYKKARKIGEEGRKVALEHFNVYSEISKVLKAFGLNYD